LIRDKVYSLIVSNLSLVQVFIAIEDQNNFTTYAVFLKDVPTGSMVRMVNDKQAQVPIS